MRSILILILVLAQSCASHLVCAAEPVRATGASNERPALASEENSSNPPPSVIFKALCQALEDNYPMLELVGWNDAWIEEFKEKIAAAPTREAAFELMDELVCRLNDYHTRFSWPGEPNLKSPPIRVEPVITGGSNPLDRGIWDVHPPLALPSLDGVVVAVVGAAPETGLEPGDEIQSVDGVPLREALAQAWPHAVGSSAAGKLRSAADRMLRGRPDSELQLFVRRISDSGDAKGMTVNVRCSDSLTNELISSREADGVPVIRITRWSNEKGHDLLKEFDNLLAQFEDRPAIVIDVRGNGGGSDDLADQVVGRFLKAPVISSIFFQRDTPGLNFERVVLRTQPRGPWRYEGRVAVLTDEGCMSACEHFVSGMIEAGALACGTPTSGACGWIRSVDLPGGARLRVSRTYPLHTGGVPSPLLGIAPHLWAPRTLADLRAGKDTSLQAALDWLKSGAPRPIRLQPVSP